MKVNRPIVEVVFVLLCLSLTGCAPKNVQSVDSVAIADSVKPVAGAVESRSLKYIQLSDKKERLADIRTEVANSHAVSEPLQLSSTIDSANDATGIVYSQVSGVITKVLADVGDHVRAGQVVAIVNSPELADIQSSYLNALAKLDEATSQVKWIKTRLEVANSNQTRLDQLHNEGIAAQKDCENARAAMAATEVELVAATTAVTAAKTQLNAIAGKLRALGLSEPTRHTSTVITELPITSPVSGIVTQRNVNPGQSVGPASFATAGRGGALLTVANLDKVWVMLEVPQSQVAKLKLGAQVQFRTDVAPGETFVGTVTRLGENFDPQSRCVMVRTEINNHRGLLKPGMVVIASANGVVNKPMVTVPLAAVQNIDGQDCVFIALANHTYEKREICCGVRNENSVAVDRGISAGESVVTNGSFYLKSESVRSTIGENGE